MIGKCLSCGAENNLTERLCKGEGCWVCGAPLEEALTESIAQALGTVLVMSENYGCNPVALAAMPRIGDLVS